MVDEKSVLMVAGTSILAGGERNLLDLAAAALDSGFSVGLIAPGDGVLPERIRSLGCQVWKVPMTKIPDPLSLLRMRRVFKGEGYGIIHAHGHLAGMYARLAALGLGSIKTVYTLHGIHYPHYRNPIKKVSFILGERMLKSSTDRFICVCRHDMETGTRLGIIEPCRTTVIYNGVDPVSSVDPSEAATLRETYNRGGGIILHVGRFMPQKDHHTLIDAVPLVLEKHPGTTFLLAGSGKLLEREKTHASRLGIPGESLRFLGESSEVGSLIAACDLMVLPSLWEGFPYVVLEAMRAGKPVVATEVGGVPEAIADGENGLLIEPGDTEALADAVNRLLDRPEEAVMMGHRGLGTAKGFSLKKMAAVMLNIYNQLLNTETVILK